MISLMPFRPMVFALLSTLLVPGTPRTDAYERQPVQVQHYRFALTLADSTDRIRGEATVRVQFTATPVTQLVLDLADSTAARQGRGMRVATVSRAGRPLTFTHRNDKLTITLDTPARAGDTMELVVRYGGIPADGLQIKPNPRGDRGFFSDNWPTKAHQWLPTIDHISGKATMEMDVVAPASYQVISNGARVEETDLANGTRRTVWRESVPIAPWLFVLGVGHFAVQHVGDYRGVPIETWVFAADRDAGFHDFAVPTKDVLAFYSEWIGPFSYEKLANVQSNSVSGGMEAASAIFYSAGSVSGTRSVRWRNVVIHEIAHQWFGDAVTESDWNDVWLSEGFATYFTLLFIEHAYGREEFATGLRASRQTVVDFDAKQPDYRVVHEHLADMAQVTSAMTYQKGSWVLHMLRQQLGDDRFWAGIREYYARYRNGSASTSDFRQAMERAGGVDLSAFFQQWLYRGGVPRLGGTWSWDRTAKLEQTQAGVPFRIPVDIGVADSGAAPGAAPRVTTVMLDASRGRFTIAAAQEPTAVELDPHVRLLFTGHLEKR
jgi:aminopeptidase N